MHNLYNKKIGIWGIGVVGQSVLQYVQRYSSDIQILDKKTHATIPTIIQTPETVKMFLEHNDFIIPSPGIALHNYAAYQHKFISELDLFADEFKGHSIAVTGTVGKTTITSFISDYIPHALAAGNIGHAMLRVITMEPIPTSVVLELSSYQLHYTTTFAPDLAIWTNFYPNHLDHHTCVEEYFQAKCNIFKYQTADQIALIPIELINNIQTHIDIKSKIYLFATDKPTTPTKYPTFYREGNNLILHDQQKAIIIYNSINTLPNVTFTQNWIIILAALYLSKINLQQCDFQRLTPQEHRVEFVRNFHNIAIYNDSKSTIWQSTKSAIERFPSKRIALFLGGLSKGTDRTPLIQFLTTQKVTVFAFGKEAETLGAACKQHNVACVTTPTLQEAMDEFQKQHTNFDILLFSPAGSSFDLFKDYKDRGDHFKKIVSAL